MAFLNREKWQICYLYAASFQHLMKWINATGLLLQFLAFWFAAPELLGHDTLLRFREGLKKLIAGLPMVLMLLIIIAYGGYYAIGGMYKGYLAGTQGADVDIAQFYWSMGIATALYMLLMFRFRKIRSWLERRLAYPMIEQLLNSNKVRRNALIAGAILFTLGFLLQLTAILV